MTTQAWPTDLDPARLWSDYRPTALLDLPDLARWAHVGRVCVKVEGTRPLGNFKALGGMIAGLRALARAAGVDSWQQLPPSASCGAVRQRLVCASDGNHGLAVAAAARRGGADASIYLPMGVSRARGQRIQSLGARIVWITGTYDDAVEAAAQAAARGEGLLVPDTTDDPDNAVVKDVMAGYAIMTSELAAQFRDQHLGRPSHLFVQAGVGGLAAAMAQGLRGLMQAPEAIVVVEPESAACVAHALTAGRPVRIPGDLRTAAGMLSCGVASAPALEILMGCNAQSLVVDEDLLHEAVRVLRETGGPHTTPSGAAGLAGLLMVAASPQRRAELRLGEDSHVLLIATEGPVVNDDDDDAGNDRSPAAAWHSGYGGGSSSV